MSELSTTNSQPARTVEAVTLEIQTLQRQAQQLLLGYAIEIGRRLVEVKAMLPHGQWGTYIKEQVGYRRGQVHDTQRRVRRSASLVPLSGYPAAPIFHAHPCGQSGHGAGAAGGPRG